MIKNAGATEVHFRVSSPPVQYPCYFGIDTPSKRDLIGANYTVEDIRDMIGADSLGYLSLEGLKEAVGRDIFYCDACFSGNYPMEVPVEGDKFILG
jgi:amidophosphoribosyltransferase